MAFEWDDEKNALNLKEHKLDFSDAENFDWEGAQYYNDNRKDYGEVRTVGVGYFENRLTVIVYTMRGNKFRIISWRKANRRMVKKYEEG